MWLLYTAKWIVFFAYAVWLAWKWPITFHLQGDEKKWKKKPLKTWTLDTKTGVVYAKDMTHNKKAAIDRISL